MRLCPHIARANPWIVSAIELAMKTVPIGIIDLAPELAMLACRRRVAGKQTGCPSAVMGLQAQPVIRGICGKL